METYLSILGYIMLTIGVTLALLLVLFIFYIAYKDIISSL